jgi:hypothetical protein
MKKYKRVISFSLGMTASILLLMMNFRLNVRLSDAFIKEGEIISLEWALATVILNIIMIASVQTICYYTTMEDFRG